MFRQFRTKVVAAVIAIAILLTLGTVVYHALEEWSYVDSAYFTAVTLTTIGYGDIAPTHDSSKIFTIFFVFSGVGIFLFSMSIIAENYFNKRLQIFEKTVEKVSDETQRAIKKFGVEEKAVRRDYLKEMVIEHKKPIVKPLKFR